MEPIRFLNFLFDIIEKKKSLSFQYNTKIYLISVLEIGQNLKTCFFP